MEITTAALDLKRLTAEMSQQLSGSAQLNGKIDINSGKLNAELAISADSVAFQDGAMEKLSATVKAQASQIQKVNARLEANRSVVRVAAKNR